VVAAAPDMLQVNTAKGPIMSLLGESSHMSIRTVKAGDWHRLHALSTVWAWRYHTWDSYLHSYRP